MGASACECLLKSLRSDATARALVAQPEHDGISRMLVIASSFATLNRGTGNGLAERFCEGASRSPTPRPQSSEVISAQLEQLTRNCKSLIELVDGMGFSARIGRSMKWREQQQPKAKTPAEPAL